MSRRPVQLSAAALQLATPLHVQRSSRVDDSRELPTGIRRLFDDLGTPIGYQTYVWRRDATRKKGGYQASKRWPSGATFSEMRAWRTEQELRGKRPELFADQNRDKLLFATEARQDYLQRATVRAMPTYAERVQHIEEWIGVFGYRERPTITPQDIQRAFEALLARGLAAGSVNKRRTALMHLWTTLDGRHQTNPVKATNPYPEPEPLPRAPAIAAVVELLEEFPVKTPYGQQCRARLKVITWTGWPHVIVKQLQRADYPHWCEGRAFVPARKKGKGARARWLPLLPQAVAALKEFHRVNAYGHFSNSTLHKRVTAFCQSRGLDPIRVYDLRHFFGTTIATLTTDERVIMELLLVSTPKIIRRYTAAATDPRVQAAMHDIALRLPALLAGQPGVMNRITEGETT